MIETLIVHILHRKFPFGEEDTTYRYRVKTSPKLEYACALDIGSDKIYYFSQDNAEELNQLILLSKKIVTFRGDEFGLLVLRKHYSFPHKINVGKKHLDLHHILKKINKGNISLEKAVFSNFGEGKYKSREAISSLGEGDLRECCESDIFNIKKLYEAHLSNSLTVKSRAKKPPAHEGIFVTNPGKFILRPGVTNPKLWYPERPPKSEWDSIRKSVLKRDNNICQYCGHQHDKYMNIHHLNESDEHEVENLVTCCVACHAVLHMGRSLALGVIEVWESNLSQKDLVIQTRKLIKDGLSLAEIKAKFSLSKGKYAPESKEYANEIVKIMGRRDRVYLPEPLCAIFVNLKRWQI